MVEQHKATIRRMVDQVWNGGDLALVDEVVAPEHVIHYLPDLPRGPEGFKQMVLSGRSAFPDGQLTVEDLVGEGDRVIVRWSFTGTHSGSFMGISPTGKRIAINGMTMIRFADGKMVERWENSDALGMMQQLGLVPTSAPVG